MISNKLLKLLKNRYFKQTHLNLSHSREIYMEMPQTFFSSSLYDFDSIEEEKKCFYYFSFGSRFKSRKRKKRLINWIKSCFMLAVVLFYEALWFNWEYPSRVHYAYMVNDDDDKTISMFFPWIDISIDNEPTVCLRIRCFRRAARFMCDWSLFCSARSFFRKLVDA